MPEKRWALITGVSPSGMGEGHIIALLERGISVIATAVTFQILESIDIDEKKYGDIELIKSELDVTSPDSLASAVERVKEKTGGRLDFLFST